MDQQPQPTTKEQSPVDYFVRPVEVNGANQATEAYIKVDPQDKGTWANGAHVLIPDGTPDGSYVLSVSRTEKGQIVTQVFEVAKMGDGKLVSRDIAGKYILRKADNAPARNLAIDELDVYTDPSHADLRMAAMRRLQPGTPVTSENHAKAHVQLLPNHTNAPSTKITLGLVTPADMARYKVDVQKSLQASFAASPKAATSGGAGK